MSRFSQLHVRYAARVALAATLAWAPAVAAQRAPGGAGHRERAVASVHPPAALSDTARALHLLDRATFGARPADLAQLLAEGRDRWLDGQLHPERIDDSALEARLPQFPAANMTVAQLYREFPPPAALKQLRQREMADTAGAMRPDRAGVADDGPGVSRPRRRRNGVAADTVTLAVAPDAARSPRDSMQAAVRRPDVGLRGPARMIGDFVGARLTREVYSQRQLQEVMVDFWFNHFNVFLGKGPDRYLVSLYERDAIRPYVFGRFEDMLKATASHPAMLVYLDNWMSAVPDTTSPQYVRRQERIRQISEMTPEQQQVLVASGRITQEQLDRLRQFAQQAGRRKPGINENYARELMELHTLGVDGGYTQKDVIAVARAFTGWTITRARIGPEAPQDADVRFVFRPELHDRGEKVVLGTPLRPGRGIEDGLDVLHMLATSPATAHHIARELVERFVTDRPDSAMVERVARVFLDTDGDLRAVTRALFTDRDFDDPGYVLAQVKTPLEVVTSALRVSGAELGPGPSRGLLQTLRTLGELPYGYSFPTGYPATSSEWVNSGAMLNRMNFALALAAGRLDHARVDPASLAGGGDPVHALATAFLPGRDTRRLEGAVRADLAQQGGAPGAMVVRAAGLILGSPDFQRD